MTKYGRVHRGMNSNSCPVLVVNLELNSKMLAAKVDEQVESYHFVIHSDFQSAPSDRVDDIGIVQLHLHANIGL